MTPNRKRTIIPFIAATFMFAACSSWETVPISESESTVATGDRVRVTRHDGETVEFVVRSIEPAALAGDDINISLADVAKLQRKDLDEGATVLTGIGFALLAVAFLGTVAFFAWFL